MNEKKSDRAYQYAKVVEEGGKKRLYIDYTPDGNGLGSKIKGLISSWRLYPEIDELSTHFPTGKYWNAKFTDLFDFPCVDRNEASGDILPSKWIFQLTEEEKLQIRPLLFQVPLPLNKVALECRFKQIPQELRDWFLPYFRKLRFKKEIYEKADSILKTVDLTNAVGVLYREVDYDECHRTTWIDKYFDLINTVDEGLPIILCCQKQETLGRFRNRYGERVIYQLEHYGDHTPERMKEVAVNMVLLSKCPWMIGNYGSMFMEAAWYYGECKAHVTQMKPWNL